MTLFRLRWIWSRLMSVSHYRRLSAVLERPATFYKGIVTLLLRRGQATGARLVLKSGRIAICRSFMSLYIFDEIFVGSVYDGAMRLPPRTIIDIGANVGLFVLWARERWPEAVIIAYEPEPANYDDLREMTAVNKFQNVTAVQAAITPTGDSVTLYRHPRNTGGHSVIHATKDAIAVPGRTLNSALDLLPGGECDLLKVDCEGAEYAILMGMTEGVARRIKVIVYEPTAGLYPVREVNDRLEALGFRVVPNRDLITATRIPAAHPIGAGPLDA